MFNSRDDIHVVLRKREDSKGGEELVALVYKSNNYWATANYTLNYAYLDEDLAAGAAERWKREEQQPHR